VSAVSRLEHRHRRLVGVQNGVRQELFVQCVDQCLQLHAAGADPVSQRRLRDRQSGTSEDRFLAVQRQMIDVLGVLSQ